MPGSRAKSRPSWYEKVPKPNRGLPSALHPAMTVSEPEAIEGTAPPAVRAPHPEREVPRGIRPFLSLLWGTVFKFFGDGCSAMAAALSFYTFFSLPALVGLLLSLVGRVMDPETVQTAIIRQVQGLIGTAGAEQV